MRSGASGEPLELSEQGVGGGRTRTTQRPLSPSSMTCRTSSPSGSSWPLISCRNSFHRVSRAALSGGPGRSASKLWAARAVAEKRASACGSGSEGRVRSDWRKSLLCSVADMAAGEDMVLASRASRRVLSMQAVVAAAGRRWPPLSSYGLGASSLAQRVGQSSGPFLRPAGPPVRLPPDRHPPLFEP